MKYKLTLEYCGTDFAGWAIQPGQRTIEGVLAHAIETVLDPKSAAPRTPDIGGKATTSDLGKAIAEAL